MGSHYDFDEVDAFTVGAIGIPGQRTFLLQARRGRERVTVKCEKQQAAAIADRPAPAERGGLEVQASCNRRCGCIR